MRLDEKHRPHCFGDVAGQDKAVRILSTVDCSGRGIYITGKSGTGKTTLALITAERVTGCVEGITETTGRELTPNRIKDWYQTISTGRGLYGGYALIVNESHGMNRPVIEILLNVLESLPEWACIIFTTTREGKDLFEEQMDSGPFESRCLQIQLACRNITEPLAVRCQEIARSENLDGKPLSSYIALLRDKRNNMRAALNYIETGGMLR